ncbi:RNA-directed DNA polymerase, eukaryota [Tanacetum coccineum]
MLDDSCVFVQDLSRHVMGKVKDVSSISNMHIILLKEGFPGVKLSYLGGLWLLIEFDNGSVRDKFLSHTGVKSWFCNIQLASHDFVCENGSFGLILKASRKFGNSFARKRVCIKTKWPGNILERFKIIHRGKVYMVRAKELFAWSPSFLSPKDTEYTSDDESIHNNGNTSEGQHNIGNDFNLDSEVEEVADTIFEDKPESPVNNECHSRDKEGDILSPDPFELYDLLNKHPNKSEKELDPSLSHPPGFTPEASRKEDINIEDAPIVENDKEGSSTAQSKPEDCYVNEVINDNSTSSRPEAHKGGSILGLLDDLIRIGQSMGYEMEGCIKDIGNIIEAQGDVLIVLIYAPQSIGLKRVLWEYITLLISRWDGETIVMGDFNEVRSIDERFGSIFNGSSARHFNRFIETSGLTDVNLEGYAFTWSHPSGSKMSKLDRFLISDGILSSFPSISALCLDRHLSDHRPILLREVFSDFGPIPFRVFHSWFKREGFDAMVEQAWNSWIKEYELEIFWVQSILLRHLEATERISKAKLKWAIEGNENSKFFHGIINKKRSQLSIRGVINDGQWHTDPEMVKDAFMRHFANRFKQPGSARLKINVDFPNRLSIDQTEYLDRCISIDEIRCAIWDCGANKSLGPDRYTFDFFRRYWSFIVSDTQTAFVANRQILDGPFILNELLSWCKRKKKQAMIFKVDFEKAYDSVRWDYLMDVLHAFGFGPNWCKWISGTLSSSMASVLVNGSPSSEFPLFRGLKQGDPLAPFLFILIMESLHISFSGAINNGIFKALFRSRLTFLLGERARLDRLPTRSNLACRGIVMDSVLCPICGSDTETISHILFRCNLGVHIFRKICRWWEVDWLDVSSFDDWLEWFSAIRLSSKVKLLMEGVCMVAWWHIWAYRNKLLFDDSPPRQATLFDDIVSRSYFCTC